MGYRTPNIDRHRQRRHALHRLLRRAELHRRPRVVHHRSERVPHRAEQGRPARASTSGSQPEDPTIAELLKPLGLRHRPVRQEPPRRPATSSCRPSTASTSSSATSTTSTPRRSPSARTTPPRSTPRLHDDAARAACSTAGPPTRTTATIDPRFGKVGKQTIEDTGPLTTKRMETIDDEIADGVRRLHRAAARGRHTRSSCWVNFTHMHLRTHTKPESLGPGRPLAVARTTTR